MNTPRLGLWLVWSLAPLAAACASTIDRARMREDLQQAPLFESDTLARVEGLAPELSLPFAVAVAPPRSQRTEQLAWEGSRETVQGFRSWSEEERRAIESWKGELTRTGLVSELIVMPVLATELDPSQGLLESLRVAAAHHRADAVLVISEVEDSSNWLNPWSILDLTIIGAWFAPGHDVEVVTILEGALIDVHTGYLYASGQAEGTARERRAWAYVNDPELKMTARRKALAGLEEVIRERARASAPPSG